MNPVVVFGHGTWNRSSGWHRPGSPLWRAFEARGFVVVEFKWSGYCGGVPGPVIVPKDSDIKPTLELWRSEGEKLAITCQRLGLEQPHLVSHSHFRQLFLFAAAGTDFVVAQRFGTVIDLSGPVRQDMDLTSEHARSHIAKLVHVTDPTGDDKTILEGQAFDGHIGWQLPDPRADVNVDAPHEGHSGLTVDVAGWDRLGLWAHFPEPAAA